MVATLSVQVREAGAELGAAARPGDGLPRGAGGPAPGVLPLLRPVARSELACVLCLLSLVSCLLLGKHNKHGADCSLQSFHIPGPG